MMVFSREKIVKRFNMSNDGMLSLGELSDIVHKVSSTYSQEDIEKRFKEIDVNGNGKINATEFVSWLEKVLKKKFDMFDSDGDGKITAKELHSVMTTYGKSYTEEDCAEKIRVADTNSDDCLNFEEFKAMVLK